ncbi:MAG: carboxypeptidase regulatory-like domain-containing protein [Flavobacteriales bacterium]
MHPRTYLMSRPLLTTLLLVAASLTAVKAQKLQQRMVERYSEVFDYPKVAAICEDLEARGKADIGTLRRLALAYRKMDRPDDAEAVYTRMMATGAAQPDDVLVYADLLRANGKYKEALDWYGNYDSLNPGNARVQAYLKQPQLFDRMMRDSTRSAIRTVPINSAQADLGMSVLDELLLFSSARGEGAGGGRTYRWDEQPYLNLYSALLKGTTAEDPMVMRKDINSRYHDGTVSYDSLAKRMYYTRNNYFYGVLEKSQRGDLNLGIYFSDVVTGEFGQQEWGNLIPFDHNDPDHNYGHPFVSPDGRRMYFTSDRPGGEGGTDIWFCDNLGNQWGAPQNMGPKVNTTGDEMYPMITLDSVFYFASDGHPGLGGLDLFRTRLGRSGPGYVFNLGYPINTRWNDHSLLLLNDSVGFLASDRAGGLGSDDIYGCTIAPPMLYLAGRVIDKVSRQPIDGALITLKDGSDRFVKNYTVTPEPEGRFSIATEHHEQFEVLANKTGYMQGAMKVITDQDPLEDIVIELLKYDYAAEGVVMHGETGALLDSAIVTLTDAQGNVLATAVTDASGRYAFPLQPEMDHRLKVERSGYFKQSARITTKGQPNGVLRTDFRLFPLALNTVVRLENILYDYNKWDIRPDAAMELDKLVETLRENPTVRIELSSHTDCRGKDSYNLSLSQKRAKSAVDYIISKGIDKERVVSKGYGESKPTETCACEKCSEEQHQRNRRTEFTVLGL